VNQATFLSPEGIELLNLAGNLTVIPYGEIKSVYFVKDFASGDPQPERRTFLARPKMDGLWVRMLFRDRDCVEGVLPNNLLHLEPYGFTVIPPDFSYNNQRMFVPKLALLELHVLGVVGSALRQSKRKAKPDKDQISLFE
jgi:hypothetical protein